MGTSKEQRYDALYMDIASRCSEMSHAVRAKVGAVLEKDGAIISHGWNGTPSGDDNSCENEVILGDGSVELVTKSIVLHAEENLLTKALRAGICTRGATLYVTLSPCLNCAKLIYGAGIKRVVYGSQYRDNAGVDFLSMRDVLTQKGGE